MGTRGSGHSMRFSRREQHESEGNRGGLVNSLESRYLLVPGTGRGVMAFSGSSIVIVLIVVVAYAAAGPIQGGPNSLHRDEYGSPALPHLLAKYWEDRKTIQNAKRNLDHIGGGHLVRDTDEQLRPLFDEENDRSSLEFINGEQIFDDREGSLPIAERFRDGNSFNSSNSSKTVVNPANYLYGLNLNGERADDESFVRQLFEGDISKNVREGDRRLVKNLDQIGGGHLLRNLDQIGGGHLLRNLDQIGGGHLVRGIGYSNGERKQYFGQSTGISAKLPFTRNLDQIGGGNLVRNLDHIGGGNLLRNLDHIGGGNLLRNLDHIGGGNLLRNLDHIGGGNLLRNLDHIGGGNLLRNLDHIGGGNLLRNLDHIGGGNLLRNLDHIGGGNLLRNLDHIGGGNLLRNLDHIGGGNLLRSLE